MAIVGSLARAPRWSTKALLLLRCTFTIFSSLGFGGVAPVGVASGGVGVAPGDLRNKLPKKLLPFDPVSVCDGNEKLLCYQQNL